MIKNVSLPSVYTDEFWYDFGYYAYSAEELWLTEDADERGFNFVKCFETDWKCFGIRTAVQLQPDELVPNREVTYALMRRPTQ